LKVEANKLAGYEKDLAEMTHDRIWELSSAEEISWKDRKSWKHQIINKLIKQVSDLQSEAVMESFGDQNI
jgi:hypothetical protein